MRLWLAVPIVFALCSCFPQIRLGEKEGIPPITGDTEVSLDGLRCADPIPAGDFKVTTRQVSDGCELSFDKDITVLTEADYRRNPDLAGATNLLQGVELKIKKLQFIDATTGAVIDPATQLSAAALAINGQRVVDREGLLDLPRTVTLSGEALKELKAQVDARQPATVHATAIAVLPDASPLPAKIRVVYDVQPTLLVGIGF